VRLRHVGPPERGVEGTRAALYLPRRYAVGPSAILSPASSVADHTCLGAGFPSSRPPRFETIRAFSANRKRPPDAVCDPGDRARGPTLLEAAGDQERITLREHAQMVL